MKVSLAHIYQLAILHDFDPHVMNVLDWEEVIDNCLRIFHDYNDKNRYIEILKTGFSSDLIEHELFNNYYSDVDACVRYDWFRDSAPLGQYINFFHEFFEIKPPCEFCGWEWRHYAVYEEQGKMRKS